MAVQLGKRYKDEQTGIEILCIKRRVPADLKVSGRELKRAVGLAVATARPGPTPNGPASTWCGASDERSRRSPSRRRCSAPTSTESIRTGGHCLYLPEPSAALSWRVSTADDPPS